MRYTELTQVIEDAARSVGYVNSIYRGSPYDLWNNTGVQYVSLTIKWRSWRSRPQSSR